MKVLFTIYHPRKWVIANQTRGRLTDRSYSQRDPFGAAATCGWIIVAHRASGDVFSCHLLCFVLSSSEL
jgi:hypothetical protein